MLKSIHVVPPLAFARVGPSPTPCASFMWGPRGAGAESTTLEPAESLDIAEDGQISSFVPSELVFRDAGGIRPVCPFFELHGSWEDAQGNIQSGHITKDLLVGWGLRLEDIEWSIELGNLKAFHYTRQDADKVSATATVRASDFRRTRVDGRSPQGAANSLVPTKAVLPMGTVQAAKPDDRFPQLRLRFHAPAGLVYGPTDLPARLHEAVQLEVEGARPNDEWRGFKLPPEALILDPEATWCQYAQELSTLGPFGREDYRNTPGGLLAAVATKVVVQEQETIISRCLGLVDDVSDGFVRCSVKLAGATLTASARLVVGPPDFAPANRPPVSLADSLTDRVDRGTPRSVPWSREELGELVLDILERALETADLMHRDYQNQRSTRTNRTTLVEAGLASPFDAEDVAAMLWPVPDHRQVREGRVNAMALTESGTAKHRRYALLEYLEDRFRENPGLFEQFIRRPVDPSPYWDRRMPAFMRGSDGRPIHLTRRQWEIFRQWIRLLQEEAAAAGPVVGI